MKYFTEYELLSEIKNLAPDNIVLPKFETFIDIKKAASTVFISFETLPQPCISFSRTWFATIFLKKFNFDYHYPSSGIIFVIDDNDYLEFIDTIKSVITEFLLTIEERTRFY